MLPLVPPLLVYAAVGLVRMMPLAREDLQARATGGPRYLWTVILAVLWCAVWLILTFGTSMLSGRFP